MGDFNVFKIIQIVIHRAKYHILTLSFPDPHEVFPTGKKAGQTYSSINLKMLRRALII